MFWMFLLRWWGRRKERWIVNSEWSQPCTHIAQSSWYINTKKPNQQKHILPIKPRKYTWDIDKRQKKRAETTVSAFLIAHFHLFQLLRIFVFYIPFIRPFYLLQLHNCFCRCVSCAPLVSIMCILLVVCCSFRCCYFYFNGMRISTEPVFSVSSANTARKNTYKE